jgi:hypothetical protein
MIRVSQVSISEVRLSYSVRMYPTLDWTIPWIWRIVMGYYHEHSVEVMCVPTDHFRFRCPPHRPPRLDFGVPRFQLLRHRVVHRTGPS